MTDNLLLVPIVVPRLSVQVVTGETCYRYENGFSATWAEVDTDDPDLIKRLSFAQKYGQTILVRCAGLDVTGQITRSRAEAASMLFALAIDDITYRKPSSPLSEPTPDA